MYYKKNFFSIIGLSLVWFICSSSACKKELPPCSGNCINILLSGTIINKSTAQPVAGILAKAGLHQNTYCIICSSYDVVTGQTDNNGTFKLNATFDSTLLKKYYLDFNITIPNNYITYTEPVGPGILEDKIKSLNADVSKLDSASTQNLVFNVYDKALLKINLHRTSAIAPQYQSLGLDFEFDNKRSAWGIMERSTNKDTTLTVNTAANIFTKIVATKLLSTTSRITVTDSIKCTSNGNNVIDIYY